jgi:hypothetical protein
MVREERDMNEGTREKKYEGFTLAFACLALFAAVGFVANDFWPSSTSIDLEEEPVAQVVAHDGVSFDVLPETSDVQKSGQPEDSAPREIADVQESAQSESDLTSPSEGRWGAGNRRRRGGDKWKSAVLEVVTNFDRADVTVNGIPYPEYQATEAPGGMILPAGGPYEVEVKYGAKTKLYHIYLRANETRLLIVELSGYKGTVASSRKNVSKPTPTPPPKPKPEAAKASEADEPGKVTVYSKPAGKVIVDGNATGEATPGTVEIENGRHEVQVEYDDGEISEKKIVRVRDGSRIKLFFRQRKKK